MSEETKRILKIKFTDGTEQDFEYPIAKETHSLGGRIKEILNSNNLVLELQDSVLIFPFANIKSIEVLPKPARLPENTVRNVKALGEI